LEEELTKTVNKTGFVDVNGLMEHVINKIEAFFKGTEAEGNFFVFHGGLSQWHTPEAQA
jgi:hypothetical protein